MSLTPEEIDRRVSEFTEACRREGIKLTYQRLVIFKEIAGTEEHPDAETVYRRVRRKLPTISFDTVYRATSTLEKLNVISRLHIQSDRMRLDANTRPHQHFICRKCGMVRDVYISGLEHFKSLKKLKAVQMFSPSPFNCRVYAANVQVPTENQTNVTEKTLAMTLNPPASFSLFD